MDADQDVENMDIADHAPPLMKERAMPAKIIDEKQIIANTDYVCDTFDACFRFLRMFLKGNKKYKRLFNSYIYLI